jgi:dethiobiotin synthetase
VPTARLIFVTGTDTGVGKTLLTALLLTHLRETGQRAFAIKPFCTGSRDDVRLLGSLQNRDLDLEEINPFYFSEPIAPLVASRKHRRPISLSQILRHIQKLQRKQASDPRPFTLLIEGAGGLLVPLGEGYTWADVIRELDCDIIVVSANRLGTINHTLLTVLALQYIVNKQLTVVLTSLLSPRKATPDARSNARTLAKLLASTRLFQVPFLGPHPLRVQTLKKSQKKIQKVLARILA